MPQSSCSSSSPWSLFATPPTATSSQSRKANPVCRRVSLLHRLHTHRSRTMSGPMSVMPLCSSPECPVGPARRRFGKSPTPRPKRPSRPLNVPAAPIPAVGSAAAPIPPAAPSSWSTTSARSSNDTLWGHDCKLQQGAALFSCLWRIALIINHITFSLCSNRRKEKNLTS